MLFSGLTYRSLDAKSRLVLPASIREVLNSRSSNGRLVLTVYDGCIVGYPEPDWQELEEKFSRLPNPTKKMRDFRRLVLGGAECMEPDQMGRIHLSRAHMTYSNIKKEIVVVGQGTHFEIWSQPAFEELTSQNFDDVTNELADGGIDLGL